MKNELTKNELTKNELTKNELTKNNDNPKFIPDIQQYLEQLSEREKKVFNTAKVILESSFNITESISFQEWKNKK